MLSHLDDPEPHDYPDDFRSRVKRRGRALQRRRRTLTGLAAVVVVAALAGAGLYGRALTRLDDVERLTVAGTSQTSGGDRTVLVVGIDTGLGEGFRTDTMLVVRFAGDRASVLSIPRDLAVSAAGQTDPVRVNTVAAERDYSALIDVLDAELGITVDNMIEVDFAGFVDLVDLVGGIDIATATPIRDDMSGLRIDTPACHRLDGTQALALARSRRMQTQGADGTWRTLDGGDLDRVAHQPVLLAAGLEALTRTRPDPLTADRLAGWLVDHAAVDDNLGNDELIDLVRRAMALTPARIAFQSLPVEPTVLENGANVLTTSDWFADTVEKWEEGTTSAYTDPGLLGLCEGTTPNLRPELPAGQPAPALAGPSLSGAHFDLEDHRGRYVVVSFTASWCVPCINNLPELVDYAAERSNVTLVSVSPNDQDTYITPILERAGARWGVLDDQDGTIAERFRVTTMPTHVIIDPDGRVAATLHGTVTSDDLDAVTE
mgnify:CR=1 FL=1